jgi:putative ABC transport system substrate-binding protein
MEDSLRDLGYVLGQRVTIEYKFSAGDAERLRQFAAEFVRLPVDLIITDTNPAIAAAKQATATIPIVMVTAANPIGAGFVQSLSRPGGNITGLSADLAPETLLGKQVALLLEFVPKLSRLAVLWNPAAPAYRDYFEILKSNVRQSGINLQSLEVESPAASAAALGRQLLGSEGYRVVQTPPPMTAEARLSFWAREESPSVATRRSSLPPTPRAAGVDLQHCIVELG